MVPRKVLTCIGCAITHFILGTIYCTGNIMPYMVSYIRLKDDTVTMHSMTIVFYICMFSNTASFQVASLIQRRYRPKVCIYIGAAFFIVFVYVAAALQNRIAIILVYGIGLGITSGIAYPAALMIAIACYPEKKGLIAGIIVGSFALGAFFFNFIATGIVNPNNKKPIAYVVDGVINKFFEPEVAENVPKMFLILASIYLVVITIGISLIENIDVKTPSNNPQSVPDVKIVVEDKTKNADNNELHLDHLDHLDHKDDGNISKAHTHFHSEMHSEAHSIHLEIHSDLQSDSSSDSHSDIHSDEEHDNENGNINKKKDKKLEYKRVQTLIVNPDLDLTILQALKTRQFHQIFWPYLLSAMTGLFATASYKTIGIEYAYDDAFLTIVGSIGSIMNGTMRPFWGIFFDKTSFKAVYLVILFVQISLCFTFPIVNQFKPAFLIWVVILITCSGGHFTILAPAAVRIFQRGTGAKVYAILILAIGISCLTVYFIQIYATLHMAPSVFFYIVGGLSCLSFTSTIFFSEIIKSPNK